MLYTLIGFLFALFIPGFLLVLFLFGKKEISILERIAYSIALSICILISLGIILGFNVNLFGGITALSLWTGLILISAVLFIAYIYRNKLSGLLGFVSK